MSLRSRIHRSGIALAVMGLVLSSVDANPAGEIAAAYAAEPAAQLPVAETAAAASAGTQAESAAIAGPAKAPEGGDLTHLTFTATQALGASLIAPADDGVAAATTTTVEVSTVAGAGVELQVGDAVIPFARIGKRTVDAKSGETRYTYYGVTLEPGPNTVALTPLGAAGARGTTTIHRVFGPGRPSNLSVSGAGPFRADGATADQLRVEARDAWGHHAASGTVVHVVLAQGDARLEQIASPVTPPGSDGSPVPLATTAPGVVSNAVNRQSLDLTLDGDGVALIRLIPGLTPGAVVVRAESGDASREARFFLAPNLRKPFVNGLVSAGTGAVPGIPGGSDRDPNGANSRRGRVAVFGTGALGKSLATFAYDTADTLQRTSQYGGALGTYNGDPNDRPYSTTGDASTRRDDALSRDHLFARLDNGRASAQWGEFRAHTGADANALGGFDQLVAGAKLEFGGDNRRAALFAARNDVGYDRRVFAPSGLANGVTLRAGIVVGSEAVLLATIDARTGAVIAQTPLTRGIDYSIEYATGQLHFIEIPLPFDEAFNPRQIVVTYEFDAPGNAARTVGGRAESAFGRNHAVKLGVGYVNDTSGAGNVSLATQDLSGTLRGGGWQIVHATSRGGLLAVTPDAPVAGAGGSALHAQLTRAVGANRLSLLFDRTDAGYNDPFGGLSTPGLLNEHLNFAHKYDGGRGELAFELGHQANSGLGVVSSTQTSASLRSRRAITKRFTMTAALERRIATSAAGGSQLAGNPLVPFNPIGILPAPGASPSPYQPYQANPNQSSTQASLGIDWRATSALDLSLNRVQTLGGANDVQPTQTDAQLTYDLGKGGRAFLRERWSATPVQSFAAATQALTAPTGGTHATELGLARRIGNATTVDTSYLVDQGGSGSDVFATIGVRERIALGRTKGDAFYQHATATGTTTGGGFDLYGVSLSYANPANTLRASGSTQLRTGTGSGVSISLGAVGALGPDFSVFASVNDARAPGSSQSDERIGLAWRPGRNDTGVTLLEYDRSDGTGALTNTQSGVLALEHVLRVRTRTEIVGRYAYKLDGDSYYAAHSSLFGLRLDQKIGARFDVGAEVRQASVRGIDGTNQTAFAVETGVRLGDATRVGAGVKLRGTADPSLAAGPAKRGFYLTVTSVVDRLFGWGKR